MFGMSPVAFILSAYGIVGFTIAVLVAGWFVLKVYTVNSARSRYVMGWFIEQDGRRLTPERLRPGHNHNIYMIASKGLEGGDLMGYLMDERARFEIPYPGGKWKVFAGHMPMYIWRRGESNPLELAQISSDAIMSGLTALAISDHAAIGTISAESRKMKKELQQGPGILQLILNLVMLVALIAVIVGMVLLYNQTTEVIEWIRSLKLGL